MSFSDDCLPPEGSYESREVLKSSINAWAAARGYGFVTGRSHKERSGNQTVTYVCDRACQPPPIDKPRIRKRKVMSRGTNCPFSVIAKGNAEGTFWALCHRTQSQYALHNHEPGPQPYHISGRPAHRLSNDPDGSSIDGLSSAAVTPKITRPYVRHASSVNTGQPPVRPIPRRGNPLTPVALITAGTAGVGAAAARLLSKNGIRVVVNYNSNSERAGRLVEELVDISRLHGGHDNYLAIQADLGQRTELVRLVAETVEYMGRLDMVFSNGGWTRLRDITDIDDNLLEEDWDRCFNMNVKSHLFLMHAAKEHLAKTEGVFISTASLAGVQVSGSSLAYAVTKAAQIHLIKGLAKAAGPKIRVNSVSPGLMLTEWGLQFPEERREQLKESTLLKRLVTVEDVAAQVLCFFRSKGVTGVNAVIDAGITL